MGRPAKKIDGELVRKLAKIGCTQQDVAEFLDCSHSVISERFRQDFHQGRAASKISLRRMQWRAAKRGSVPMSIHLGKVYLGQTDRVDVTSKSSNAACDITRAENPRDRPTDIQAAIHAMGYLRPDAMAALPNGAPPAVD
jgi:hypothetical protein